MSSFRSTGLQNEWLDVGWGAGFIRVLGQLTTVGNVSEEQFQGAPAHLPSPVPLKRPQPLPFAIFCPSFPSPCLFLLSPHLARCPGFLLLTCGTKKSADATWPLHPLLHWVSADQGSPRESSSEPPSTSVHASFHVCTVRAFSALANSP